VNRFVRKFASRLLAEDRVEVGPPLSRNRHFEVFADSQGQRALRLYRRLRSLARDILGSQGLAPRQGRDVAIHRGHPDDPLPIRLEIPLAGSGVRTAYLDEDELSLLLENPGVRARLGK
jgi:hypothetical protein